MASRITLSNRQENLKLLLDFVRRWAKDHRVPARRRSSLETAAEEIFQHLVTHAYRPGQPGSIAISLEETGPRLRLMFEDDAGPHNPARPGEIPAPDPAAHFPYLNGLEQIAESLIYYRTADRKNRLVVFLT